MCLEEQMANLHILLHELSVCTYLYHLCSTCVNTGIHVINQKRKCLQQSTHLAPKFSPAEIQMLVLTGKKKKVDLWHMNNKKKTFLETVSGRDVLIIKLCTYIHMS